MGDPSQKHWWKNGRLWFSLLAVMLLAGLLCLTFLKWDWLSSSEPDQISESTRGRSVVTSNGETLRNAGLVIGGLIALVFAFWRAWVAENQTAAAQQQVKAARGQVEAAQRQANTAHSDFLNGRYQRGAEMLGSKVLAVRLGGIYGLRQLAEEHPDEYHIQVMQLLCAFVRNPTPIEDPLAGDDPRARDFKRLREDMQTAMTVIGNRGDYGLEIERRNDYQLDLSGSPLDHLRLEQGKLNSAKLNGAYLRHAHIPYCNLIGANLFGAILSDVNLRFAHLNKSDLSLAQLHSANLASAELDEAKFYGAALPDAVLHGASLRLTDLSDADVSAVDFSYNGQDPAVGLTQAELVGTRIVGERPPHLRGVVDWLTGDPLVWDG